METGEVRAKIDPKIQYTEEALKISKEIDAVYVKMRKLYASASDLFDRMLRGDEMKALRVELCKIQAQCLHESSPGVSTVVTIDNGFRRCDVCLGYTLK